MVAALRTGTAHGSCALPTQPPLRVYNIKEEIPRILCRWALLLVLAQKIRERARGVFA